MSRMDVIPTDGLEDQDEQEASLELKPLPWLHCVLLIFFVSALCYGVGYAAIDLLVYGRL